MAKFRLNQKVQVAFDSGDYTRHTNPAYAHNGKESTISKIKYIKCRGSSKAYYELKEITSEWGIPYGFTDEQLIPIEE